MKKSAAVGTRQSVATKKSKTKTPAAIAEPEDKIYSDFLPLVLRERREKAEQNGWIFEQDADGMLSAMNDDTQKFCGEHSSLFALLNQIEGEDTGDHGAVLNIVGLLNPPAPPFDVEAYEKALVESGSDYDPDDAENNYTPEETRANYFYESLQTALFIRETETAMPSMKPKELKKAETDLIWKKGSLEGALCNTHNFFGKESAEYLREKFALFGFNFDEDYRLILKSAEPETAAASQPEPPDQTALHRRAVKEGKYHELIRKVIRGHQNISRVEDELKLIFGSDWDEKLSKTHTDEEFQEHVKVLWLGDCDGDEDFLTKEFRTPTIADAPAAFINAGNLTAVEIPLDKIIVSQLEPQGFRRQRFRPDEFDELAISIKKQGLINPITVRPLGDGWEIVAGERRYRATEKAGLPTILCFVKDMSDDAALDVQIQENLQRKDPHPLDEARSYEFLIEKRNSTVADLMARYGKKEDYILNRLKLNNLTATVLLAFQNDEILFTHALELAKYPRDAQKEILPYCFTNYGYDSQAIVSVPRLVAKIQEHYLLRLTKAPFSIKSKELRADGLACTQCPERTNAEPLLFSENFGKNDSCLNRNCWGAKTLAHIQIQRAQVVSAKTGITEPAEIAKKLKKSPLVSSEYYVTDADKPKEGFVGKYDFTELKKDDECASAETGVFLTATASGRRFIFAATRNAKNTARQSTRHLARQPAKNLSS